MTRILCSRKAAATAALLLVCGSVAALLPNAARAADPTGNWLTESGSATVKIATCGAELCGTIVALKEPNDPATGRPKRRDWCG